MPDVWTRESHDSLLGHSRRTGKNHRMHWPGSGGDSRYSSDVMRAPRLFRHESAEKLLAWAALVPMADVPDLVDELADAGREYRVCSAAIHKAEAGGG